MHDNKSPFSVSILCIVTVRLPCSAFCYMLAWLLPNKLPVKLNVLVTFSRPNSGTPELQNTAPKLQQQYNAQKYPKLAGWS